MEKCHQSRCFVANWERKHGIPGGDNWRGQCFFTYVPKLSPDKPTAQEEQLLGVLTYRGHRLVPIAVVLAAATGNLSTNYPNLELEEQGWEPLKGVFTTLPGCSLKHKALEAPQRKIHWIVKLGAELASNTFWNCYGHRITSKTQTEKLEAKSRDSKTVSIQETSEGL